MTPSTLRCLDGRRRHAVRRQGQNGLDYLEVSDDPRKLTVFFLGEAPEGLGLENVRITGGRRVRGIKVTGVEICPRTDPEMDHCMVVTLDREGDFSTYTLCLVDLPEDTPFDPRYRCLEFDFKAACPTRLDCKEPVPCLPESTREPEISYLAKDYASFRRLILDRLAVVMPDWKERHVPDLGITLVELLAYVGDHLSYHQDAVATEAYLDTARQRISVRRHARLVDYRMHEGCNARAWVHLHTSTDVTLPPSELSFLTRFRGMPEVDDRILRWEDLAATPSSRYEVFEPLLPDGHGDIELDFRVAHNEIRFHTWGDAECCLPRGATAATLVDGSTRPPEAEASEIQRALHLRPGDVLILEEAVGPETGVPEDANPSRRHPVRLIRVEPEVDELLGQPILEVTWAEEDALPFPLCVSVVGRPPDCALIENVSVARGNVALVDHGRTREEPETLGCVPVEPDSGSCERQGRPADVERRPGRFRPRLAEGQLTFSQSLSAYSPARGLTVQDPRASLPWIRVSSHADADCGADPGTDPTPIAWFARSDLMASGLEDPHYVVEMDDRGRAHLRFGDGELGKQPEAGHVFQARYRTGNGPRGNVGADAIGVVVSRALFSGVNLAPRNPLPAEGGIAPEPVEEVKLFAPHAFRRVLERAVTPDDYAELAGRHPNVQRAAAELRWNGSWYEVRVAIDPFGHSEADPALLEEILRHLYPFRRIGHDLAVRPAQYVALDVALEVCVAPSFLRGHVKSALRRRFGPGRQPDGSLGFFHPDELTFGDPVASSRLVAAAQAIKGVESVAVSRLERLFEGPNGEIEAGVLPIGPLEIARLDNDPSLPEHGRIQFDLRGGR